jgi:uncharacterized peroxidase-related enzyme
VALSLVPFIEPVSEDDASGATAEMYESDIAEDGCVSNLARAFSHAPEVMDSWGGLILSIRGRMDRRRYELATLAAAEELRSSYCMLAHGGVLASQFYDEQRVVQIVADRSSADLDETDRAVMDLAAKVAADATSVSPEDVDRLKRLGLSDGEIFDVVATSAARAFFTKVIDGLGFQPDPAYAELAPDLRDALVVGRPIEKA